MIYLVKFALLSSKLCFYTTCTASRFACSLITLCVSVGFSTQHQKDYVSKRWFKLAVLKDDYVHDDKYEMQIPAATSELMVESGVE